MQFYNKELDLTPGYTRWISYIEKHPSLIDTFKDTNILLVLLHDYRKMYEDNTLDEYIQRAKSIGIDFIMLEDPHNYPAVPDVVYRSPIKTFILHNDFTINNSTDVARLYWPVWLFFVQDKFEIVPAIVPEYMLSSANRNFNYGRPGKIYNYQTIKSREYFDKILFTKFRTEDNMACPWPETHNDLEFGKIIDDFILDYNTWPLIDHTLLDGMAALTIDVYTKSLFHLVAESGVRENLISEKTYKIFHVQQIPILCGAKNAVAHLRAIGFDMFDDIVDHSRYDGIDNFKRRIDAMQDTLESIFTLDHNKILADTAERRQQNFNWLHSEQLSDQIVKPIIERLSAEL